MCEIQHNLNQRFFHVLRKGKYHRTEYLRFYWFGFNQANLSVVNFCEVIKPVANIKCFTIEIYNSRVQGMTIAIIDH